MKLLTLKELFWKIRHIQVRDQISGPKKSRNLLGKQQNHATSQDKKGTQRLETKKNHATSRNKKITQALRTKNLTTFRDRKNYATS